MDYGIIAIYIFALLFTLAGGALLFSKKALDWMYKNDIWKVAPPFNEKEDRWLRKATGGGLFIVGVIMLVGVTLGLIFY